MLDFWACERLLSVRILGNQQNNLKARKLNDHIFFKKMTIFEVEN